MYRYEDFKDWIFGDEGQRAIIEARDHAFELFRVAGAALGDRIVSTCCACDSWKQQAILERLVELKSIRQVDKGPPDGSPLCRIYVRA